MLCLYLFGQNCLHITFSQYFSSETYSRKYDKVPNILINACKNITEKMNLLKMCGPQIRLCLFTFRLITSKQLNSLTTLDTFSWLGGAVVTHPLGVRGRGINTRLRQGYLMFEYLFCFCFDFTFLYKNTFFVTTFCKLFCNINSFSMINTLHDLWLITTVKRYRPSIFKCDTSVHLRKYLYCILWI